MTVKSPDLTTLDFLKAAALVLMIVDHVGFYWVIPNIAAPEGDAALWLRAIGRWCVPIWFFLVGYATTKVLTPALCLGALVVMLANLVTGTFLLPFNVLVTMMAIRLVIDPLGRWAVSSHKAWVVTVAALILVIPASYHVTEYGTLGLLIALAGWVVRHQSKPPGWFLAVVVAVTIVSQSLIFPFSPLQNAVMSMGVLAAFAVLFIMRPTTHPDVTGRLPAGVVATIQFLGRHTLFIYVVHLVLFLGGAWALGWGYPVYGFLDWDWTMTQMFTQMPRG